ncbi:hypothetical protein BUALT_Bualt17G0006200 [Buddleja alternifolia]|uniref:RNase H type-1 domain-containing protein n=1 Tax=Buddleja alternifolia TaxID=168488 RepID=A0AAV6WFT3_9LAMI|nr:hypothetical protein BUALT_Bualt17G0006200 [Buddleja alternifolia]
MPDEGEWESDEEKVRQMAMEYYKDHMCWVLMLSLMRPGQNHAVHETNEEVLNMDIHTIHYRVAETRIGIGGMSRDEYGRWLGGFRGRNPSSNVLAAELHAILHGLEYAWEADKWEVIIESDCSKAIKLVREALFEHQLLGAVARNRLIASMKGKGATSGVKQMLSMVSCVAKSKCIAIRSKTDAIKAQLMITALTVMSKKKKFSLGAISGKINEAIDGIFHHHNNNIDDHEDESKAIVLYNNNSAAATSTRISEADQTSHYSRQIDYGGDDDDKKYPDLRHSLFDEEEEKELVDLLEEDQNSSVIDQVKNSKENGENFNLEDEIDEVADMFITKFHKRMRLQKLLSFKRHQQMMERST